MTEPRPKALKGSYAYLTESEDVMRLPRMNYKKITLKVILDVSAEEDHIIDLEDRNEIKEAVTNAIRQQYENGGFDIAYCFVDGFSVTQDADRSRDDAGAADPRNDRE